MPWPFTFTGDNSVEFLCVFWFGLCKVVLMLWVSAYLLLRLWDPDPRVFIIRSLSRDLFR